MSVCLTTYLNLLSCGTMLASLLERTSLTLQIMTELSAVFLSSTM